MYRAEASINLSVSAQRAWEYLSNYQNFDEFMSHVDKVELEDSQTSRWRMRGPLGIPVSWRAVTKTFQPPHHLAWQSIEGSLETRGFIQIAEQGQGSKVTVHVEYVPPGGAIGEAVASLFKDPQKMLEQDLERLGEIASGWPVEAVDTRPDGGARGNSDSYGQGRG